MPFDPKTIAAPTSADAGADPEETGEQDALSAAFEQIRASIDAAEQSLVTSKFKPPGDESDPAGGGAA